MEAAEAPGTPTAEAKRPVSSPRAEEATSSGTITAATAALAASPSQEPNEAPTEGPSAPPAVSLPRHTMAAAAAGSGESDLPPAEGQNGPAPLEPHEAPAAASTSGKGEEEGDAAGGPLPNGVAEQAAALQLQSDLERQAHLAQVCILVALHTQGAASALSRLPSRMLRYLYL